MNPAAAPDLVPRHVAVNGDLERLLIAALTADSSNWEGGGVIVNGVSANRGSAWMSLADAPASATTRKTTCRNGCASRPDSSRCVEVRVGRARRRTQPSARVESRTTIS